MPSRRASGGFFLRSNASPCSFPSGARTFRATCRCRLHLSAGRHEENQSHRARSCSCASCEHADRLSSKTHAYVCACACDWITSGAGGPGRGAGRGRRCTDCARQVRRVRGGYRRRSASVCAIWMPRFPRRVRDGLPDIQGVSKRLWLHDLPCTWRCFMRHRTQQTHRHCDEIKRGSLQQAMLSIRTAYDSHCAATTHSTVHGRSMRD